MMHRRKVCAGKALVGLAALVNVVALTSCRMPEKNSIEKAPEAAAADPAPNGDDPSSIHRRAIAVDLHADTVQFIIDEGSDITRETGGLHLDATQMRAGGLDAQFFSIWVEPQHYGGGGARAIRRAEEQIAAVRALAEQHPEVWTLATTAADIRRSAAEGKLAALMGLEGGYAIDERLEMIGHYHRMGVRYMSPTWSVSTSWAGSSGDRAGQGRGLSEFGRAAIREMNRLGVMIDVSHVSDKTFWDIIDASTKPVIASHSNARALADVPRNLSDEQIRALVRTGGIVCVVFYPAFVEEGWNERKERIDSEIAPLIAEVSQRAHREGATASQQRIARDRVREREYARRLPPVSIARVVDHIDHIVRLGGIDHVGIGSDFDGIQAVPRDLATVADLPNLTAELVRRGYSESDIAKILGGNILRVMEEVEPR